MADLSDELLKLIAERSGRCYPHEGKAMAQEIIRWRAAAKEAAAKAAAATTGSGQAAGGIFGLPYP